MVITRRGRVQVLTLAIASFFSVWTYAQQPPDTVASDAQGNTASGTGAMSGFTIGSGALTHNSAFGYGALLNASSGMGMWR